MKEKKTIKKTLSSLKKTSALRIQKLLWNRQEGSKNYYEIGRNSCSIRLHINSRCAARNSAYLSFYIEIKTLSPGGRSSFYFLNYFTCCRSSHFYVSSIRVRVPRYNRILWSWCWNRFSFCSARSYNMEVLNFISPQTSCKLPSHPLYYV